MRVLYVQSGDDKYGAPRSMMELIKNMRDRHGIEPIVVTCFYNGINSWCEENNIESYVIGNSSFMVVGGSNWFRKIVKHILYPVLKINYIVNDAKAKKKIENLLGNRGIDLVHTNVNRVDVGAYYAKKKRIPHIWHLREFGKEDYNCMYLRSDAIPFMNSNTTKFISISDVVKNAWIKKGLEKEKIKTIYNGIDMSRFNSELPERVLQNNTCLRMVFVGIISETKGQIQIIKALKELKSEYREKTYVDIYGGGRGNYITKLKKYVIKNKLDKQVSFKGYSSNIPDLLSNYDVGIVSSKSEAFGRVTVEYMAAGLCVIASDTGANPELISHKYNGLLYHWNDVKSLAAMIEYLFNHKEALKEMRIHGFNEVRDKYPMDLCADNIYKIYKEVLKTQLK